MHQSPRPLLNAFAVTATPFPPLPPLALEDAEPARLLLLELETRIATQRLHYRAGDEETAVKSVHELFPVSRALLAKHWQAQAFATAAIFLLNRILRANTSRWHRWMVDEKFTDEQARRKFRYELQQLRPALVEFAELLALIAENDARAASKYAAIVQATPPLNRSASLGGDVRAGIATEVQLRGGKVDSSLGGENFASAAEIDAAERRAIQGRRGALDPERALDETAPVENAAGLCLSGGGIRSATFGLGIIQVLVREGLLERFDYLSTVSGGGYLGAFLSTCLGSPAQGKQAHAASGIRATIDEVFHGEGGRESPAVRHLRNNSRYLLSGGVWGRLKMFGLLITGIITNILLMLPLPLGGVLVVALLYRGHYWDPGCTAYPSGLRGTEALRVFGLLGWIFLAGWILLPLVRNLTRGAGHDTPTFKTRTFWEAGLVLFGLVVVVAGLLLLVPVTFTGLARLRESLPLFGHSLRSWINPRSVIAAVTTLAPFVFGLSAARSKKQTTKKWTTFLFALSGPLLALVVFLVVGNRTVGSHAIWSVRWVAIGTGLLTLWGWVFVDINQFSPHAYYRNRLCECYLALRQPSQRGAMREWLRRLLHGRAKDETFETSGIGALRRLKLSEMNETQAAPYHLVNTAVNLPASREPNLRGRDCDFFSFSRDYCGGPICGYIKTKTLEKLDSHVDLGTAMAVSGAAASANMGVHTLRHLRFLLTLLNVRLGYWLRNPLARRAALVERAGPALSPPGDDRLDAREDRLPESLRRRPYRESRALRNAPAPLQIHHGDRRRDGAGNGMRRPHARAALRADRSRGDARSRPRRSRARCRATESRVCGFREGLTTARGPTARARMISAGSST